jgi:hypothetical protein
VASLATVLQRLAARGWKSGGPAREDDVRRLEAEFDLTWPADYRDFLLAAGGGPPSSMETVTGLLPVSAISLFNRAYRFPWNFPGLLGFANDGFLVYAFDFRGAPPVVVSVGLSSSVWEDVVVDADSFTEWLERRA